MRKKKKIQKTTATQIYVRLELEHLHMGHLFAYTEGQVRKIEILLHA